MTYRVNSLMGALGRLPPPYGEVGRTYTVILKEDDPDYCLDAYPYNAISKTVTVRLARIENSLGSHLEWVLDN